MNLPDPNGPCRIKVHIETFLILFSLKYCDVLKVFKHVLQPSKFPALIIEGGGRIAIYLLMPSISGQNYQIFLPRSSIGMECSIAVVSRICVVSTLIRHRPDLFDDDLC